ncbi:MAG: GNAT family N-acetyltransferase [Allomuricauda sp.]
MIKDNPFSSATFVDYWGKHFLSGRKKHTFPFAKNLSFYKSRVPGLYINTGKNLTKGTNLELGESSLEEKGNCFLIYDVIDFDSHQTKLNNNGLVHYAVRQYPGYLIDLQPYTSLDDFLSKTFKKSSRYKLRKYKKRLEECFNISFRAYEGEISKDEYDTVFIYFRKLLEKRFEEKQISNNNLDTDEWDFYKDVAYPMILENKASLLVLYKNEEPISITLSYLSDNRVFDAITVFDTDYAKFHLGSIKIMYLVDWCLKNGWKTLDFSKGHFDYKLRWSNKRFDFHYHIWFDKKSWKAQVTAYTLKLYFTFKQYLREKKINEKLHKLTFAIRNKESNNLQYSFEETLQNYTEEDLIPLDMALPESTWFNKICYEFLYLFPENEKNIKVYQLRDRDSLYLIKGTDNESLVRVNFDK